MKNRTKPPYKFSAPCKPRWRFGYLSLGPEGGFKEMNNNVRNYYAGLKPMKAYYSKLTPELLDAFLKELHLPEDRPLVIYPSHRFHGKGLRATVADSVSGGRPKANPLLEMELEHDRKVWEACKSFIPPTNELNGRLKEFAGKIFLTGTPGPKYEVGIDPINTKHTAH